MSRFKTAPVTDTMGEWVIRRRKGNRVRYQNTLSGAWDRWTIAPREAVPSTLMALYAEARQDSLTALTVASLRSLAGDRGIKVASKARKADIIAALTDV